VVGLKESAGAPTPTRLPFRDVAGCRSPPCRSTRVGCW